MIKIPCGYTMEPKEKSLYLVMPTDQNIYRDICMDCLYHD